MSKMSDLDVVQSDVVRRIFLAYLRRTRCTCNLKSSARENCFRCQTIFDMKRHLPEITIATLELYALAQDGEHS